MKVLIVDDSARFRAFVRSLLAGPGVQIEECSDGEQACRTCAQNEHDIVLMDIRVERMNGLAAARTIKTQCPNARVALLTSFDDDDLRRAAREAGASAYFLKDDLAGLIQWVSTMVSKAAAGG